MSDKQKTALISIALSAIVAVLAVFGYNVMVVQPEVAALNAQIDQLQQPLEEPAGAVGDTNLTNLVLSGDLTVDGTSTLSGGVAWDWPQSVTAPTAVATATPAFYVNNPGAANVSFEVRDSATPVFQVRNGGAVAAGAIYSSSPVLTKDANYPVVTTDSGAIIKNTAVVSATFTLPAAAAGLNYCIFNYAGSDVIIEFADNADVALNEVNSAGDSVTNTTAYDSICLTAIDAVNWVTLSSVGTWADGN